MERLIAKLTSGRFVLTFICGVVFWTCALNKLIPAEAVVSLLAMVFTAYFNKARTNGETKEG